MARHVQRRLGQLRGALLGAGLLLLLLLLGLWRELLAGRLPVLLVVAPLLLLRGLLRLLWWRHRCLPSAAQAAGTCTRGAAVERGQSKQEG